MGSTSLILRKISLRKGVCYALTNTSLLVWQGEVSASLCRQAVLVGAL